MKLGDVASDKYLSELMQNQQPLIPTKSLHLPSEYHLDSLDADIASPDFAEENVPEV